MTSGWWRPRDGHPHYGADLFTPTGTPVLAVAPGKVIRVQRTATGEAAGIWVGLEHDRGLVTRYMHLSAVAPGLAVGQSVRRGQVIGATGESGAGSTGPHLHFDIKAPAALLPSIEAAAGKPATGWSPLQEPWGYGVPAEPWLPVDRYPQRTIDDAKRHGVPLYKDRAGLGLAAVALLGFAAWGAWKLLGRR
jgi:murein DD-endopeptidase MepM/ murein hydrolase activator NlpD